MRFRCLVACAVTAPMLIAATEPVRLQPSSQWIVDYAENSCRLIRTFGEDKSETSLLLESTSPERIDMVATGTPLRSDTEEVGARFLPVGGKTFGGRRAKTVKGGVPVILWSDVPLWPAQLAEKFERESAERISKPSVRPPPINLIERATQRSQRQQFIEKIRGLEIETRRNQPVILETGPMGDAIRMFDKCSRDSLTDWGVDPDLEDKIVRPVWSPNALKWLDDDDWPLAMLRGGSESDVNVRLLVDASGKATKCTSLSHFEAKEFNQVTCNAIMKRAKFEPAELADGTKVPSYKTLQVRWVLGEHLPTEKKK